jgi:hypothetical protein
MPVDARNMQVFDETLLQVMQANNTRFGLSALGIGSFARAYGFSSTEQELTDRLEYLLGKGLVEEVTKVIGRSARSWKITAAGRAYLDEHNL